MSEGEDQSVSSGRARPALLPARPVEVLAPEAPARRLRVVLAHDWLCGRRGGELVLERIAGLIGGEHELVAILTMFDDGGGIGPAVDGAPHVVWPAGRGGPGAGALRRWLLPVYPRAVAWLSGTLARVHAAEPIDLVISSSSAAIKGLRVPGGVPHLCYCHTPARYVWAPEGDHSRGLRALGLRAIAPGMRRWDKETSGRVTRFVANSREVASRIRAAYGVEAGVVAPPVRTGFFTPDPAVAREDFWLCAGALEPYKRVDLAIEAARRAGAPLLVAGKGSALERLRMIAKGTRVEFITGASDAQLRDLYRRARLLVFPQVEDFGIVAVEAQACGTPVVARRAGGALDSIVEGVTGSFFDQPTPDSLLEAVAECPSASGACRVNAERFGEAVFDRGMRAEMAGVLGG